MSICKLTKQAEEQVTFICQEHSVYAVSLDLKGGGCAGFEYVWDTINTIDDVEAGSFTLKADGGNLVIGPASVMFLAGTEIDYKKSIVGSSFQISNPNAKASCGCGISVDFDVDSLNEYKNNNTEMLAYPAK